MKNLKNRRFLYIVLTVAILILNALPIIFSDDVGITKYSIVSVAFAVCSVVYAVIAFIFKEKGNLFHVWKYWFSRALYWTFSKNESHAENEEYQKKFELSAFIYCITIPTYITFAFFVDSFYSALLQAISWTLFRLIAIIVVVTIPSIIKSIKEKKQQHIKDEADKKEQERRESMGKWK